MSTLDRRWIVPLVVILVTSFGMPVIAQGIKAGQQIPTITGRNLSGKSISLEDYYKDSIVMLAFWSIYCKPCVAEISSLITLQDRYKDELVVIGINTDGELPPARIRTFIERYEQFEKKKINYQIIFDEHNKITKQLGVGFLPTVLALDKSGVLINSFVGFEEKDEAEIFEGIEELLPGRRKAISGEVTEVFEVEIRVPACGFYDETGWRESFYGNKNLDEELDKVATVAREMALKNALKKALKKLGVELCEKELQTDCFQPYGVFLKENPWNQKDCLTNLLNSLEIRQYTQVLETNERWLGYEYYVRQRISVNMNQLKNDLENEDFFLQPISINFVVINMRDLDRMKFQDIILSQSKYIGKSDFPAYNIYTNQENFISELDKMDFGGYRAFISDAGSGVIEVEIWR